MSPARGLVPWLVTAAGTLTVIGLVAWPTPTLAVLGLALGGTAVVVGVRGLIRGPVTTNGAATGSQDTACTGCPGCSGPDCAQRPVADPDSLPAFQAKLHHVLAEVRAAELREAADELPHDVALHAELGPHMDVVLRRVADHLRDRADRMEQQ